MQDCNPDDRRAAEWYWFDEHAPAEIQRMKPRPTGTGFLIWKLQAIMLQRVWESLPQIEDKLKIM